MSGVTNGPDRREDEIVRARVPADVDAPDKVLYGLTFRQLAILAVAAVVCYGGWQALHRMLPVPVLLGAGIGLGGLVFGLAVGRRDGLPLDAWLLAAVTHHRSPKALTTTDPSAPIPAWVDTTVGRMPLPAPLKLPADAVDERGEIRPRRDAGGDGRCDQRQPGATHRGRTGRADRHVRPLAQQPVHADADRRLGAAGRSASASTKS